MRLGEVVSELPVSETDVQTTVELMTTGKRRAA